MVGLRWDVVTCPFILGPRLLIPFMDFAEPLAWPLEEPFVCSILEKVHSAPGFVAQDASCGFDYWVVSLRCGMMLVRVSKRRLQASLT